MMLLTRLLACCTSFNKKFLAYKSVMVGTQVKRFPFVLNYPIFDLVSLRCFTCICKLGEIMQSNEKSQEKPCF
jgi:hypothetical protein